MCVVNFDRSSRLLLLAALTLFILFTRTVDCDGDSIGGGEKEVQWQILTKLNYSSQIRLHPHLLLLVTVPWCGESRSLMKELAHVVASDKGMFSTLRLTVLYRNVETMLANAIDANDGVTIFYYHNTLSYKYRGKLRVQNILSSVQYVMSFLPHELPLKSLATLEELRDFLHPTDKAVLLLEFCGWTPRLLAMNKTMFKTDLGQGDVGVDIDKENNGTLVAEHKDNRKRMESGKLVCDVDTGFSGTSWMSQFNPATDSLVKEVENVTFTAGDSCSLYEFQQLEVAFQKLITVAREFFLPPERIRFAVINERSLLPWLRIEEPISWSMAVHISGCPSCSTVLKEVDDLRNVLQSQSLSVLELEDAPHGAETTLPAKKPAMLLFVDRSSNSMQIRRDSEEVLKAFKQLARDTEMSNQARGQSTIRPDKNSVESNQESFSTLKHPRLQPLQRSQNLILEDKMSVTVVNEGQQINLGNIVPDLQGTSVQEILTYVLNQKKKLKLSSIAKDAGFQLLSKDFDIEVVESLPSNSADQSTQDLVKHVEGDAQSAGKDEMQMPAASSSAWQNELPEPSDVVKVGGKEEPIDKNIPSYVESEHEHHGAGVATDTDEGQNIGETRLLEIDENEPQGDFLGLFYVCDGQYRLLETLTGRAKIPSVVVIDPISETHYVLAEQSDFSYFSLSAFVNNFVTRKLSPYLQSSATVTLSRDGQRPPFVNQDFHESDSIPLITAHTFPELVLGSKSSSENSNHAQDSNVLVLFSNGWCGFCQRMELVVREVYRAVKSYANIKMNSSRKEKSMLTGDNVEDISLKLPLIYMMDCTQNDCSLIIKPIVQRDVYPLLLLFPADKKNSTVSYEGDITVSDIIKFLAAHGNHVQELIMDKGLLQNMNSVKYGAQTRSSNHEVLLKDRSQNTAVKYKISAEVPSSVDSSSHEMPKVYVGCVLSASEKLVDAHPFDESKILIVKADQISGFQGLIFNKLIKWESLEDLVQESEIVKEAPLSFGGPVMKRGMPLVALTHTSGGVEVLPDVYLMDQLATHNLIAEIRAGNRTVEEGDHWFFLGYSSWGWDQLFLEIAQGAWVVSQGNVQLLEWPSREDTTYA